MDEILFYRLNLQYGRRNPQVVVYLKILSCSYNIISKSEKNCKKTTRYYN